MKKALSLLLTAAMLLTMIAALAVTPVSAKLADTSAERTPLNVTFQSGSENYCICDNCKNLNAPVDWSFIFDTTNTTRKFVRAESDFTIIGKFDQPTKITSFVLNSNFYPSRMNALTVQFSADGGNTWSIGYTLQEDNTTFGTGTKQIEIPTPGDDTAYTHVKLFYSLATKASNTTYIEMDVYWVAFYNEVAKADQLIQASTHKITSKDGLQNGEKFFNFYNTDMVMTTGKTNPDDLIQGKLDKPTVLSDIYVRYHSAYMNNTVIKASVDGVTWNTIVTMNGQWGNANNGASQKIAHFHVTDTTAYNYISFFYSLYNLNNIVSIICFYII